MKYERHGFSYTKIYKVFAAILDRCYNEDNHAYEYYGAMGITVWQEWRDNPGSFCQWALDNGYKEGLEIDREDNDGNYTPDNCRIVTHKINMNNQRRSCGEKHAAATKAGHLRAGYVQPVGEDTSGAKLTNEKARALKIRALAGENLFVLAEEFGVSYATARSIKIGETWKHIEV